MTDASEENTVTFPIGSTVQVMRGKHRQGPVVVLAGPDASGRYAVQTESGELAAINAVNLRAPAEYTITADKLALEIQAAVNEAAGTPHTENILRGLVSLLGAEIPGFESRISWPGRVEDPLEDEDRGSARTHA